MNGDYVFYDLPKGPYQIVEKNLENHLDASDVDGPNSNRMKVLLGLVLGTFWTRFHALSDGVGTDVILIQNKGLSMKRRMRCAMGPKTC
mmetsp:Transcript_22693/g.52468  ORF Transcript_22693/g.52468 Transcript_22693/m.52468 type:complete len:89 (+) Transcript_22693:1480-1746(+)